MVGARQRVNTSVPCKMMRLSQLEVVIPLGQCCHRSMRRVGGSTLEDASYLGQVHTED